MHQLAFHVSHVRVEVESPLASVCAAMARIWAPCLQSGMPVTRSERFAVRPLSDGFVVEHAGRIEPAHQAVDVLPVLEGAIYRGLRRWHEALTLIHGACLWDGERALLMVGESGAGKSTMAYTALSAGYQYLTDELAVFDGERVWGVPRAVQFDPLVDSAALPGHLTGLDRSSYRMQIRPDLEGSVPLFVPESAQVRRQPVPAECLHLVRIGQGSEGCHAMDALSGLRTLHEAAFSLGGQDLGRLLHNRACSLSWRRPAEALQTLQAHMAGA